MWGCRDSCCYKGLPAAGWVVYSRTIAACLQSLISDRAGRGFESTSWNWSNSNPHDWPRSFSYVFIASQGYLMSAASQQSPSLCPGHLSDPWAPLAVSRTAHVLGGNTFIFNPSWPTSWWTWPPPRRIIRSLHLLKTKAGRERLFKHVALTPVSE